MICPNLTPDHLILLTNLGMFLAFSDQMCVAQCPVLVVNMLPTVATFCSVKIHHSDCGVCTGFHTEVAIERCSSVVRDGHLSFFAAFWKRKPCLSSLGRDELQIGFCPLDGLESFGV